MYGHGISQTGELVDMAVDKDIIDKSGSWYSYGDERIGQGRENAKTYLADNPEKMDEIRKLVRDAYGMDGKPKEEESEDKKDDSKDNKDSSKDSKGSKDSKDKKNTEKNDGSIDLIPDSDKKETE